MKSFETFLSASPVCFFAVANLQKMFEEAGFRKLPLYEEWKVEAGGKYFVTVGDSSIYAFVLPKDLAAVKEPRYRMIGAHTDQPGFRIKPSKEIHQNGYAKLNAEVYGGPIYNTWLDRPLSLAGRVTLKSEDMFHPQIRYVDLKKPVLIIPNLAIHMNRKVNEGEALNPQVDLLPIGGLTGEADENMLLAVLSETLGVEKEEILDFDLFTYIVEEPKYVGFHEELFSAAHLDDLVMIYTAAKALLEAEPKTGINVFCGFDHEEIGSHTKEGAGSATFSLILEKMSLALGRSREQHIADLMQSFLISGDVAHATHPNHPEKHDPYMTTYLGKGPVIKMAAGQSYVTQSSDYSVFEQICRKAGVPVQKFTNRSDARGGSTIGPIISRNIPCRIVDMGVAILSMHSCRELMAAQDYEYTKKAFTTFYNE